VIPVQLCLIAAMVGTLSVPGTAKKKDPHIYYNVTIDTTDLSGFDVTMRIEGAPQSIRLAMAIHPEYNDRFWRYVRGLRAESIGKPTHLAFAIEADNAWRIFTRNGHAVVHYRIELPREDPRNRAVWHTTLRADGASLNSTDTFLYLTAFPNAPVKVDFNIPDGWDATSGAYRPTGVMTFYPGMTRRTYVPPLETTTTTLLDSPILLGRFRSWGFTVQGIPHSVVYWPLPNATPFDTTEFVGSIERFARQAFALFGKAPYERYTFLIEDGAWGGLEHVGSVSIGAQSRDLARDPRAYMDEIAHEYFHTWNLVALNPRGPLTASANPPTHTRELWFSEGVTMYYAETLRLRAGIPEGGQTRVRDLEKEIDRFYGNSGNSYLSPERGSWASIDPPDVNTGDYLSNYYTQGRLIAHGLDIIIGDSTGGRKGIDDVMRSLYDRFAKKSAFTGVDIEQAADGVCKCNTHRFFEDHVRGAKPIDFNPLLAPLGLRVVLTTEPVADSSGTPYPDLRITAYAPPAGGRMRVRIMDPRTVWVSAGLHTGMEWTSLNRIAIDSLPDFRRAIRSIKLGDVVPVEIIRNGVREQINVRATGYERTRARIVEIPDATPEQIERRRVWMSAVARSGFGSASETHRIPKQGATSFAAY
jgi:predicted metalloprotease with PDZ domain